MPEKNDVVRYTFPKKNKLCLKRDVDRLFRDGKSFISYPLRIVYHTTEMQDHKDKVLIVVGKKYHKRANKRNRIKRLIRENYRIERHHFLDNAKINDTNSIHMAMICVSGSVPTFSEIRDAMLKALNRISRSINENNVG